MSIKISTTQVAKKRLMPLAKLHLVNGYEWTTPASNRHLIFNSEPRIASNGDTIPGNGLKESGAILRIGKKILIDLDSFDQWIDSHREGQC